MTDWKYFRVMPLATESLSVASMIWELVMKCDTLLDDEEEYLDNKPSPKVFIVEIEL